MNFATSSEKRSEKPGQELVITTEEENSQRVTVTSTCRNYRYYRVRNIQQLSQCLRREKLPQHWAELAKCVMMGKWQWHCHRPIDCWQNSWVLLQNKCKLLSWMFYFFKNYYWISVKLGGSWIEEEFTRLWDLRPSVYLQRILALSSHPCPLISRLSLLSIVFIESQRHGDISLALGRGMHSDDRPKSLSLVMNCTVHQLFSFNSWTGKPENRFIFKHLTLL